MVANYVTLIWLRNFRINMSMVLTLDPIVIGRGFRTCEVMVSLRL